MNSRELPVSTFPELEFQIYMEAGDGTHILILMQQKYLLLSHLSNTEYREYIFIFYISYLIC